MVQDHNAVAERHDQIHVVLDDDEDSIRLAQRLEACGQFRRLGVIVSGRRLIEQENLRVAD